MEKDFANIEGMFKINTDIINKAIVEIAPEHWFRKPGDDSNHLLWVMGHLIVHRGKAIQFLDGEWDVSWASMFARGAKAVGENEYPAVHEIKDVWSSVSHQLFTSLGGSSADFLAKPAPKGPPSFDGKISGTVAFFAFHDAYHAGQVSYLRKWLGYGQTVG